MSSIRIHFDGDIATNHQVSLRVLAKSLTHLQKSLDRAYLENHYGSLYKYAKMKEEFYDDFELLVQEPKEGGYILDFLSEQPILKIIIDRVSKAIDNALKEPINLGVTEATQINRSHAQKINQLNNNALVPRELIDMIENPDELVIRKYGDRAITREIDQILSLIRSKSAGDSSFEIIFQGTKSHTFEFNREKATSFHSIISKKQLGDPVIYTAEISSLDRYNKKGKIKILETGKISNLFFYNESFFEQALSFFSNNQPMRFIGSPLIEYGAYDPNAGDIYFIGLTNEWIS